MEFHEKLQELRKRHGLTQEELAQHLYVTRTAVSKWESGRGYPHIDSLKRIAAFFSITVDELLSGEELLTIAQEDRKQNEDRLRDLIFGLLDISIAALLLLPFFGQRSGDLICMVSLMSLTDIAPYIRTTYFLMIFLMVMNGFMTLTLQGWQNQIWAKMKRNLSLILNAVGTLLFILSPQPYAAAYLFLFLCIKLLILLKRA